jgi:DNA polymerase-3 subunit gamma/tau
MATDEGIDIEPEALTVIARQATGSLRDAISLLDQLASAHQKITLSLAQEILGTATSQAVLDLVEALIAADGTTGLLVIHRTLDAGTDARQFARQIVEYLRSLLLVTYGNVSQVETTTELRAQMARHVQDYDLAHLLVAIQTFNRAAVEARGNWQPALPLEMALMEALTPRLPQTSQAFAPSPAHEQKPAAKEAGVRMEAGMYLQAGTPHNDPGAAQVKPGTARTKDSQPEPDRPSAQDVSTSHLLGEVWPGLLAKVREINPKTYGLLNSARTRAMHGNVLHLGFASDLLTSQMERSNDAQMVRQVLSELMGMEVVLRCYTVSGKQTAPPPDVDSDGIVAAALRDLGGEIVDIQ